MTDRQLNSGVMPNTDFRYEEFEGLLGSYHLAMQPLKKGNDQDRADFKAINRTLNGFAERHGVQLAEEAVKQPRPTAYEWGQPRELSGFGVVDLMSSFGKDFGVGMEPNTPDSQEHLRLKRLVLGVLHRHEIIQAGFKEIDGVQEPVEIISTSRDKFFRPLRESLKPPARR